MNSRKTKLFGPFPKIRLVTTAACLRALNATALKIVAFPLKNMEEPELRALIQKLTKQILPKFETEVVEAEARIELVLEQPEIGPPLADQLGIGHPASWPRKNEEVAKRNREGIY